MPFSTMSTMKDNKYRMRKVINVLLKNYPNSKCSLNYNNAFQLLISTILSAQCTDKRVNKVTATLFKEYPNPEQFKLLRDSSNFNFENPTEIHCIGKSIYT